MIKTCLIFLLLVLSGCASHQYVWNDYDEDLESYYGDPTDRKPILKSLKKIVDRGEIQHRVAPGLYAEYGNFLLESGDVAGALVYFEKEKTLWPESRFFMEKMIRNAQKRVESKDAKVH